MNHGITAGRLRQSLDHHRQGRSAVGMTVRGKQAKMFIGAVVLAVAAAGGCGEQQSGSGSALPSATSTVSPDLVRIRGASTDDDGGSESFELFADGNRRYWLTMLTGPGAGYYQAWDGKVLLIYSPTRTRNTSGSRIRAKTTPPTAPSSTGRAPRSSNSSVPRRSGSARRRCSGGRRSGTTATRWNPVRTCRTWTPERWRWTRRPVW